MWITLLARFWYLIPIALLTASTGWYRHEASQEHAQRIQIAAEYKAFTAQVDALGKAQEQASKLKDAEHAKTVSVAVSNRADALRLLRDVQNKADARSRDLPIVPAAAVSGGAICYDQKAVAAAIERYRQRIAGVVAEGDSAQIDAKSLLDGWPK